MRRTLSARLALLCTAALAWPARADAPDPALPAPVPVQQECAACHVVFPPGLLPEASWRRLMGSLGTHFGTDASLDAPTRRAVERWLVDNAGTSRRVQRDPTPPPQDRITLSAWFQRKHHEVAAATWTHPAVRSAANCAACHPQAERGDFDEHAVRIPR
jgi:hypothetical protein